jgi:hypothetical protein
VWSNNVKDHLLAQYYTNFKSFYNDPINRNANFTKKKIAGMISPVADSDIMEKILKRESFNIYLQLEAELMIYYIRLMDTLRGEERRL